MFYDKLITFPTFTQHRYVGTDVNTRVLLEITQISAYEGWEKLKTSIPFDGKDFSIRTGKEGGITVIENKIDNLLKGVRTIMIATGHSTYYIFNYEESLPNIYNAMEGVSIINDGKFIALSNKSFIWDEDRQIISIPVDILSKLINATKSHQYDNVDQRIYELLSILPNDWFNLRELFNKVIHIINNCVIMPKLRIGD